MKEPIHSDAFLLAENVVRDLIDGDDARAGALLDALEKGLKRRSASSLRIVGQTLIHAARFLRLQGQEQRADALAKVVERAALRVGGSLDARQIGERGWSSWSGERRDLSALKSSAWNRR